MNSEEPNLNFTFDDLKQLTSNKSMFIVCGSRRKNHRLTAIQYLAKINLLFIYSINNNN